MPNVVQQSVTLPAPPETLYALYLDPEAHAAMTGGGAVRIAPTVGTEWSAFDGRIHGRILALMPDRRVVQSWRSFEWQDDELDAVLILTFWPQAGGTRLELVHANVPERLYDTLM